MKEERPLYIHFRLRTSFRGVVFAYLPLMLPLLLSSEAAWLFFPPPLDPRPPGGKAGILPRSHHDSSMAKHEQACIGLILCCHYIIAYLAYFRPLPPRVSSSQHSLFLQVYNIIKKVFVAAGPVVSAHVLPARARGSSSDQSISRVPSFI